MIFRILIGIGDGELADSLVERVQRAHFRNFSQAFVVSNFRRWSGLATKVQHKSGFFFGREQETIQRRGDAGFSQWGRDPQVLETVPFVDVFAQKMNDRDMLGSDFPAGGSLETRCTH